MSESANTSAATAAEDEVLFARQGALGVITLNRPKALNALTLNMCLAMRPQLLAWAEDPAVKAVLIKGAGERAFCAGGDIRALYDSGRQGTDYAPEFYRHEYRLNAVIHHFKARKPHIAFLDGIVMGGGVGVSVHGSHRIVTEKAVFAMPETGIGLFPDVGGSHFLPRCPGQIGMFLALTGTRLKTADCLYAGIGTQHVPSARLEALEAALAGAEYGEDPHGTVDRVLEDFLADAGGPPLAEDRPLIDHFFALDSVEEIVHALEHDGGDWALAQARAMRAKSPTSMKIAFRQLREGARRDFDDCMRMEYRLARRFIAGHDFYEGVRATVIDKDQTPHWRPARLEEVSEAEVDAYFAPLGADELTFD